MVLVLKAHRVDADREHTPQTREFHKVELSELLFQPLNKGDKGGGETKTDLTMPFRVGDRCEEVETLENRLCRILSEEVIRTLESRLKFREILNRPHLNRGESVEERIRHLTERRVYLLLSGTESHDVGGVHEVGLVRINGINVGHIRDRAHHHAQLE